MGLTVRSSQVLQSRMVLIVFGVFAALIPYGWLPVSLFLKAQTASLNLVPQFALLVCATLGLWAWSKINWHELTPWLIVAQTVLAVSSNLLFVEHDPRYTDQWWQTALFGDFWRGDGALYQAALGTFALTVLALRVDWRPIVTVVVCIAAFCTAILPTSYGLLGHSHTVGTLSLLALLSALQLRQPWVALIAATVLVSSAARTPLMAAPIAIGLLAWSLGRSQILGWGAVALAIGWGLFTIGSSQRVHSSAGYRTDFGQRVRLWQLGLGAIDRAGGQWLGGGSSALRQSMTLMRPPLNDLMGAELGLRTPLQISQRFSVGYVWSASIAGLDVRATFENGRTADLGFDRAHNYWLDRWLQHGLIATLLWAVLAIVVCWRNPIVGVLFLLNGVTFFSFPSLEPLVLWALLVPTTPPLRLPRGFRRIWSGFAQQGLHPRAS